jgi:hypothetical protein
LIDTGQLPGVTSSDQVELVAARRRIAELEHELAIHRRAHQHFSCAAEEARYVLAAPAEQGGRRESSLHVHEVGGRAGLNLGLFRGAVGSYDRYSGAAIAPPNATSGWIVAATIAAPLVSNAGTASWTFIAPVTVSTPALRRPRSRSRSEPLIWAARWCERRAVWDAIVCHSILLISLCDKAA